MWCVVVIGMHVHDICARYMRGAEGMMMDLSSNGSARSRSKRPPSSNPKSIPSLPLCFKIETQQHKANRENKTYCVVRDHRLLEDHSFYLHPVCDWPTLTIYRRRATTCSTPRLPVLLPLSSIKSGWVVSAILADFCCHFIWCWWVLTIALTRFEYATNANRLVLAVIGCYKRQWIGYWVLQTPIAWLLGVVTCGLVFGVIGYIWSYLLPLCVDWSVHMKSTRLCRPLPWLFPTRKRRRFAATQGYEHLSVWANIIKGI